MKIWLVTILILTSSIAVFSQADSAENLISFDEDAAKIKVYEKNEANIREYSSANAKNSVYNSKGDSFLMNILKNKTAMAIVFGVIEFSCAFFLIGYLYNRNKKFEEAKKKELKKNIAALREEKIIQSPSLEKNKANIKQISFEEIDPVEIAKKAKETSSSKGEILLALKLKAFEADKKCSEAL